MEPKELCPFGFQGPERLGDLRPGHAVLGIAGGVHDLMTVLAGPQGEYAAGIIAAEDRLRNMPDGFLQEIHVGQVVQVDIGAQPGGQLKLLRRGLVGGEHDLAAGKPAFLRHHQLGEGGTVHAAALLP